MPRLLGKTITIKARLVAGNTETASYSQDSGALCADESTNGHIDVSGAFLAAIEAHLVLWHTSLKLPQELRPSVGLGVGRRGGRNGGVRRRGRRLVPLTAVHLGVAKCHARNAIDGE